MTPFRPWLGLVFTLLLTAAPARAQLPADAQFTYEWAVAGQAVTGAYSAVAGQAFTLQVYVRQTAGATDVFAAENGLFGGGVRATYGGQPAAFAGPPAVTPPAGTPGVIAVTSVADVDYNPLFTDTATSNGSRVANATFAQFRAATENVFPDGAGVQPVSPRRTLLGEFTFQAPGTVGQTTNLTAETVPTLNDTVAFNTFTPLDLRIAPTTLAITLTPVPEPAGVLAVAAAAGWLWRRARRQ